MNLPLKPDLSGKVTVVTGGSIAQLVMECTGANACIRGSLDMVCNAGRITFTGWPKAETSLPTEMFTKKEIDIREPEPAPANLRRP